MTDLLRPDQIADGVPAIDFSALSARGIVNFCFDLDNTLAAQGGDELLPGVRSTIVQARQQGHIKKILLISNVILGAGRIRRLHRLGGLLDIPPEHTYPAMLWDRKPGPRPFRWALKTLGEPPESICMVGDQIYSDVLGANRFGFYTILVPTVSQDHWTTRLTGRRRRERRLLKKYGLEFGGGKIDQLAESSTHDE